MTLKPEQLNHGTTADWWLGWLAGLIGHFLRDRDEAGLRRGYEAFLASEVSAEGGLRDCLPPPPPRRGWTAPSARPRSPKEASL